MAPHCYLLGVMVHLEKLSIDGTGWCGVQQLL